MAHIIAPMIIEGVEMCCDPVTRRTIEILIEDATVVGPDEWEIYRAQAYGDSTSNPQAQSNENTEEAVSGAVVFGVCCGTQVVLELWGEIETLNNGYDTIEVLLNGQQQFYYESQQTTSDPWDTIPVGPFTITLALPDRPCGNVININGSTGDAIANNNVWWRARLVSIS